MKNIGIRVAAALCLASLVLPAGALGMTWNGSVRADETVLAEAPADGLLEELTPEVGQWLRKDELLGRIRQDEAFAPTSGTIEAIHPDVGDDIDGVVLEIDPAERYEIACTNDGAKRTVETMLVHGGERLFIRCQADGEHTAEGIVTSIDGESYRVLVKTGELFIGETVSLYRSGKYEEDSCVGSGTVEASALVPVSGTGKLLELLVKEGDAVARGDLLWRSAAKKETDVVSPADGIVTAILAAKGDQVTEELGLAEIATHTILSVPVEEDDAERFSRGVQMRYYRADDPHETLKPATVTRVLHGLSGGAVTVELRPEEEDGLLPIGLTITLTDEE
ncbi:MAG: hypothetical protein K5746_01580 [Clostridiales bacterium]|nr:hypothetical protein [Clostridiales bacterium]